MTTTTRGAFMTAEFRDKARKAALRRGYGYTVSKLLRDNLEDLIADPTLIADLGEVPASGKVKVHAEIDDELWARAHAAADQAGIPISHFARLAIKRGIMASVKARR